MGRLYKQPSKGYRYNIDSFLLLRFAVLRSSDVVCDLGSGVGILGLLALQRYGVKKVTAIEIQEELAGYARENVRRLGFDKKMQVLVEDWKKFDKKKPGRGYDVVISNPPYRALKSGKLSLQSTKAVAKHELKGGMRDLLSCARRILKPSGRLCLMYPTLRLEELVGEMGRAGFKAQRMAFIHPYVDRSATQFMVEAVFPGTRELKVEAPVVVHRDPDHYHPEIEAWVGKKRRV